MNLAVSEGMQTMVCDNECAQLLSELADQYERSSTILVQLELALELRTPAKNGSSEAESDASVMKEGMPVASGDSESRSTELISRKNGSNISPWRCSSSSSDVDSDFDVADLTVLRFHSMTNLKRDDAEEFLVPIPRASSFQQRLASRPMRTSRSERCESLRTQCHPQSQPQSRNQKSVMDITNDSFISCNNADGRPSTCAHRALSDPAVALSDCRRRPTATATKKNLELTGVSLLTSASARSQPPPIVPPPLLQRSTSRGPLLSWTSTGSRRRSGTIPPNRLLPSPGTGTLDEPVTPAMAYRTESGNAANPFPPASTQRSFETAIGDTLGPMHRQLLGSSTHHVTEKGIASGPVGITRLLPALACRRRKRGFTEHGGYRMPVPQAFEKSEEDEA
ncbi:hypothetical protein Vretimale_8051 [Volvox reticuliferus]|uniref:Uncharacterized protein n=1 Tax=Volvox reticuliferus TaxID=1737510 RepID=A0A8J4GA19_9CHLO|nr:hypothetical protein Vretifemale_5210 [Volvox reticuliferus]GIM03290.1 hypothetical protein Vretimale_8051 [Volvox reticuliferus]